MLVKDSNVQLARAMALKRETRRAQEADYAAAILDSRRYFGANPEDMANPAKNAGHLLPERMFLGRLSKVVPGGTINISLHPTNPHIHFIEIPGYEFSPALSYVCEPMAGVLPEYSTMAVKKVKKWDVEYRHFDKADLPKGELVETRVEGQVIHGEFDENTGTAPQYKTEDDVVQRWEFVDDLLPGQYWAYEPDVEVLRGWRTILALLVQAGIVPPEAVEREFGVATRASWKALLGKTLN